jgi:hypothetical protein
VWNEVDSHSTPTAEDGVGTGLLRLRERLRFLYGDAASLTTGARDGDGYEATLTVPRRVQW